MPDPKPSTQLARLSALEEGYKNLGREIGGVRSAVDNLAVEIRSELNRRGRVQWSPLVATVAVIIALFGAFAQGPISEIKRNDEAIRQMTSNRFTDKDGDRHETRLDRVEDQIHALQDEDFGRAEFEKAREELKAEYLRLCERVDAVQKEVYSGQPRNVR